MSDFDVVIPKDSVPPGSEDDDDRKHALPHWTHVAHTLLNNQLAYCELIYLSCPYALHVVH